MESPFVGLIEKICIPNLKVIYKDMLKITHTTRMPVIVLSFFHFQACQLTLFVYIIVKKRKRNKKKF